MQMPLLTVTVTRATALARAHPRHPSQTADGPAGHCCSGSGRQPERNMKLEGGIY